MDNFVFPYNDFLAQYDTNNCMLQKMLFGMEEMLQK